jgi:hypothetical protein
MSNKYNHFIYTRNDKTYVPGKHERKKKKNEKKRNQVSGARKSDKVEEWNRGKGRK